VKRKCEEYSYTAVVVSVKLFVTGVEISKKFPSSGGRFSVPSIISTSASDKAAATVTKMSARAFAVGYLNGTLQPAPGVNIPAVPLPVLRTMTQTNTWPPNFFTFLL